MLLSDGGEKVKDELFICRKLFVSSHTKISVNVKRAFKNIKDTVNLQ